MEFAIHYFGVTKRVRVASVPEGVAFLAVFLSYMYEREPDTLRLHAAHARGDCIPDQCNPDGLEDREHDVFVSVSGNAEVAAMLPTAYQVAIDAAEQGRFHRLPSS
jgi:hypothetical protein